MPSKLYPKSKKFPDSDWNPKEGKFYKQFIKDLENFDEKSKKILTDETKNILGKCINPCLKQSKNSNTGTVIGYVQSGKTTSFNALAMLALDNDFKLIIVLGGRNKNLLRQNISEFELNLDSMIDNDEVKLPINEFIKDIGNIKFKYLETNHQDFPSIPIVTVHLKHQQHIRKLTSMIKEKKEILNSTNVLIIDDEADSASLNAKANSEDYNESAVYAAIKNLRKSLNCHSYVQYTATPQAILLISKSDLMSPDWVRFISPGKNYIGTKDIFNESFVPIKIPSEDILGDKFEDLELPKSLFKSIFSFLLVAAQQNKDKSKNKIWPKNISLMIHPSRITKAQDKWGDLIQQHLEDWRYEIEYNLNNWKKNHRNDFKEAYLSLKGSTEYLNQKINSFEELFDLIPEIVNIVSLSVLNKRINNRLKKEVNWKHDKYNILIGGDLLDRGYVVKGLVTTYMPRKGSFNADTLQQRGRFYGYKKEFFGFIRAWMSEKSTKLFKAYLKSESFLYEDLKEWSYKNPNKPIQEWKRRMVLEPTLQPCRDSIVGIDLYNNPSRGGWLWPKKPLPISKNIDVINNLITAFTDNFELYPESNSWTSATKSLIASNLSLKKVIEILDDYDVETIDSPIWSINKAMLGMLIDKNYSASIVLMGANEANINGFELSSRTFTEKLIEVTKYDQTTAEPYKEKKKFYILDKKVHQGRNDKRGYPGGDKIFSNQNKTITFQIHRITLKQPNSIKEYESLLVMIKMPPNAHLISELENPLYINND